MQLKKKKRRLRDIEVKEVSYVGTPANRMSFLFFKEDADPECGYVPGKPKDNRCAKCGAILKRCRWKGYAKMNAKGLFEAMLKAFNDEDLEENPLELEKDYEELVEEEMDGSQIEKAEKLKPSVSKAIAGAMRILAKWKDDLPSDAKKALQLLSKLATGKYPYPAPYKKSEDEGEEMGKAGAKVSKHTATELAKAMKILEALLPEGFLKALEEEAGEQELGAMVRDIHSMLKAGSSGKEENGSDKESDGEGSGEEVEGEKGSESEILKTLNDISDRLKVVEKQKGVKKGLESDGGGGGEGEGDGEDEEEDLWKSIAV